MKFINDLQNNCPTVSLSAKLNNDLAVRAKTSDEELEKFIGCNIKLALTIIKQLNVPFSDDSVMAAVTGMLKAVKHYDRSKGKITTYLRFWIIEELFEMLGDDEPVYYSSTFKKSKRKYERLMAQYSNKDISPDEKERLLKDSGISANNVKLIEKVEAYNFCSYDEAEFSLVTNGYLVEDNVLDSVITNETVRFIHEAMENCLDDKERLVVSNYFGIGCRPVSFIKIGSMMNLSNETVRKIKNRALEKLALSPDLQEMMKYV